MNQNIRHQTINIDRIAQLEQNMKFLQEQHQATLVALHQEVESLRQKNRGWSIFHNIIYQKYIFMNKKILILYNYI